MPPKNPTCEGEAKSGSPTCQSVAKSGSPTCEGVAAGEAPTKDFHYVYILTSQSNPTRHYIGQTKNLNKRLQAHNSGQVKHTANNRPWQIETALAFRCAEKALAFEHYLKTHSGRAFARKRL